MNLRSFFLILLLISVFQVNSLALEPTIRIGLSTNARSVSITTGSPSLVSFSPNESPRNLATAKVTVSPRAYRPPVIENYRFEIKEIATKEEADQIAKDIKEATGENAAASLAPDSNTYLIKIDEIFETIEEANSFKDMLSEKGFDQAEIVTDKIVQPSNEAIALSEQLKTKSNTEVRSLISAAPAGANSNSGVKAISDTQPVVDPNLKEIIVSGAGDAKFSSFKPIAFGSLDERAMPVKLNGKAYRGKIEVFVNSRGSLTVVNVVAMEDYIRGVVPNELSLPAIEAQKAQAVAARTYAWANMNNFASQGFDLLPTTRSQVYRGFSSESQMGTRATIETSGVIATYKGKPINAMYTSTCGGRTENVENIYEFNDPYLRGVECSIEGNEQFAPFMIKSSRELPRIEDEKNLEIARIAAQFAVNGFVLATPRFSDSWFSSPPGQTELTSWANQLALKFGKPFPGNAADLSKPVEFGDFLAKMIYAEGQNDTLLSEADISYQLSFNDAADIDADKRANIAALFRDGWLSLYPDFNFHPHRQMPRGRMLSLIASIFVRKKWNPTLQSATTKSSAEGKLVIKSGKGEKQLIIKPDAFLFRQFGGNFYQVKEIALIGGENVSYQTNAAGEVVYIEVRPSSSTAAAERTSNFTFWNTNLSASAVQSRLSRYVRGIGALYDVNVVRKGVSRRAIELEIMGSNGRFSLKGGKIRSALRLKEQLFVMNKRYDSNGRVSSYSFSGRGWGHGIGMCQVGAYGMAKAGLKYDRILKHYYSGISLTKAY